MNTSTVFCGLISRVSASYLKFFLKFTIKFNNFTKKWEFPCAKK